MKNFDPSQFVAQATTGYTIDNQGQRYGQYLYNQFRQNYPDVLVPDEADCFYNCNKVVEFFIFLSSL